MSSERYSALEREHAAAQGASSQQYSNLVRSHEQLQTQYTMLMAQHAAVTTGQETSSQQLSSLARDHEKLQRRYEELQSQHAALRGELKEVQEQIESPSAERYVWRGIQDSRCWDQAALMDNAPVQVVIIDGG